MLRLPSKDPTNVGVSATHPVVVIIDFSLATSGMSASYHLDQICHVQLKASRGAAALPIPYLHSIPFWVYRFSFVYRVMRRGRRSAVLDAFYVCLLYLETCKELFEGVVWVWLQLFLLFLTHTWWKTPPSCSQILYRGKPIFACRQTTDLRLTPASRLLKEPCTTVFRQPRAARLHDKWVW